MQTKSVLLVDDDNIFNFLGTKLLQRWGIANEIHTAGNGKEALDLLNRYYMGSSSLPDVILLDLNMPVMDGFSFIEAFKKLNLPRKEKVSIIILTSSQDPRDMARAKNMGITHFLSKPLTEEALLNALAV
jgi:CheY-like chemotaxis protein